MYKNLPRYKNYSVYSQNKADSNLKEFNCLFQLEFKSFTTANDNS